MSAKLHKLSPILRTEDLRATTAFYETVLGFKGQSNFSKRGDVDIMFIVPQEELQCDDDDGDATEFFSGPALTGSLYIVTERVEEYWEAVKDKVIIKTPIADREYRMRDFSILDNNGYELVFGEDISCAS